MTSFLLPNLSIFNELFTALALTFRTAITYMLSGIREMVPGLVVN